MMVANTKKPREQQRFKSNHHDVYTEEINKIALSRVMVRDCKHLIKLQGILMEQTHSKYAKVS